MNKPVIGITSYNYREKMGYYSRVFANYSLSTQRAGGLPLIIPQLDDVSLVDDMLNSIDGLLLTGGEDILPTHYDEQPLKEVVHMNPDRDAWEIALTRRALERDLPVFGICRGHQVLNVAAGGSLYQHVNVQKCTDKAHMLVGTEMHHLVHRVSIEDNTLLARCFDSLEISVNSYHNQAVKTPGEGVIVSARSQDGLIEGIELPGKTYAMGVQWHPEQLTERHPSFLPLFARFVEAGRG